MTDYLLELNEQQRAVVTDTESPILVLAGAGSGKTRCIIYRAAYLIREKRIKPWKILIVTFTNKAAGELTASYDFSLVPLGFSSDDDLIRSVADLASDAMEIELADRERMREILQYFRFTDREARSSPEGFGHAQSGYGYLARFFIGRFVLTRERASTSPESFSRMAKKSVREQLAGAGGIGWLSTKGDHRVDQVRAGRAYQRVHLKACALGLALQPVSQIIADYPGMAKLRSEIHELLGVPGTHTIQMLFRLGYAAPVPATPRRALGEFF